jgi:hypothetical protein
LTLVADFNSSVPVPFSRFRQVMEDGGLVEGVSGSTHLAVSQRAAGANMSVDIAVGQAWVEIDTGTRNGFGHVTSDAVENRAVTASNATNPRVDQVVLQWNETAIPTGSGDVPTLVVLAGTPTAGAQISSPTGANYRAGAATLGNDRLLLADVLVPAASSSVTSANIVDRRPSAVAPGSFRAYRNAAASLATGAVVVFDTDSGTDAWDASNWYDTGSGVFTPQVAGYYQFSWIVASSVVLTADVFWHARLQKNGADHGWGSMEWQRTVTAPVSVGSIQAFANGTTDAFRVILTHGTGGSAAINPLLAATSFGGFLIGRS